MFLYESGTSVLLLPSGLFGSSGSSELSDSSEPSESYGSNGSSGLSGLGPGPGTTSEDSPLFVVLLEFCVVLLDFRFKDELISTDTFSSVLLFNNNDLSNFDISN